MKTVDQSAIRSHFAALMSDMYRKEVPAYGDLIALVQTSNEQFLAKQSHLKEHLVKTNQLERISLERHGAIRVGTSQELHTMRRLFAIMGMFPVGYYDLSVANLPVHSTAFRPIEQQALAQNPFRVFTSLLRLDLISKSLQEKALQILEARDIFTDELMVLIERAERDGGLIEEEANDFVKEAIETFRWHKEALVSQSFYEALHQEHPLLADIVSFRVPHINHLTPRSLDIDDCQEQMPQYGINPKVVIEGPPKREIPILLRQTSFKALQEHIDFIDKGDRVAGVHTARFGEIEQRGVALTKKGRLLYDRLLDSVRGQVTAKPDGSNVAAYYEVLERVFSAFPDDHQRLHDEGLAYYTYRLKEGVRIDKEQSIEELLAKDLVDIDPIVYEDFLPVSAAGIFQSNLGDGEQNRLKESPNQAIFEEQLGTQVFDMFACYDDIRERSINSCLS